MYRIPNIFNVSKLEATTIDKITAEIRSKAMLELSQPVRNAKTKEEREVYKKRLPAFTLCKVDGAVDSENFISTEYIIYDIDGLGKAGEGGFCKTPEMALEKVKPFSVFAFISPSGKGIKFVIKLDRPVNLNEYRYNRKYYRDIFAAETGFDLDVAYNSYHTFYGYDKHCTPNHNATCFAALTPELASQNADVNIETVNKDEITDVVDYLCGKKLDYWDWVKVCFALHTVEGGKEHFARITTSDTSEDHRHRNWEAKWKGCDNTKDINIGSLYHVAFKHHYHRKDVYIEEGMGKFNPFLVWPDGMYYKAKDKRPARLFGFTDIHIAYQIHDSKTGNKIRLRVNEEEQEFDATILCGAREFRTAILRYVKGSPYMVTNNRANTFYDMLFEYLDRSKSGVHVERLPGAGLVDVERNIWNFGSVICIDKTVIPYEPVVIHKDGNFSVDDMRSELEVNDNPPLLIRKLNLMHETYLEHAATAIGWAVANVFYAKISHHLGGGFPILFLYGDTESGKSKLAHIILAMFGVKHPDKSEEFKVSLTNATDKSMPRILDGNKGIPTFFDEYKGTGDGSTSGKNQYAMVKNIFEGTGKVMGQKTNDNKTHRLKVEAGVIFAAVHRELEGEAVNRCVYVDMSGLKNSEGDAPEQFDKEYVNRIGEFSGFIMHMVCERTWGQWLEEFSRLRKHIATNAIGKKSSRIAANWAAVGASYNLVKTLIQKPVPDDWWVICAEQTQEMSKQSDEILLFLDRVYDLYVKGMHGRFIFCDHNFDSDKEGWVTLSFQISATLTEVRLIDRNLDKLIKLNAAELSKKLRAHKNFIKMSTKTDPSDPDGKKISVIKMRYEEQK